MSAPKIGLVSAAGSSSDATDVSVTIDSVLAMSKTNCNLMQDINSDNLSMKLWPSATTAYAANCQTVSIDTNAPGYTLTARANSDNSSLNNDLTYQNPTAIMPMPTISSTTNNITTPGILAANTWGFALPGRMGFDAANSYSTTNQAVISGNSYANLPTVDTTVATQDTMPVTNEDRQTLFYYGVAINDQILAGTYGVTITYTATAAEVPAAPNVAKELKKLCTVTSGDGLYADAYIQDRCVYRGANPDNHIIFNGEVWRIISVEADDTLKIVRDQSVGDMAFDAVGIRHDSSGYCQDSIHGCKAWGSLSTTLDASGANVSTALASFNMPKLQLPSIDASLNSYLNTSYYNSLNADKAKINRHYFNIGLVNSTVDASLGDNKNYESANKWFGRLGLINVSDYIYASLDTGCVNFYSARQAPYPCQNYNYMQDGTEWWSINPMGSTHSSAVWLVNNLGYTGLDFAADRQKGVRPVLFLKPNITLSGSGTSSDPYKTL